MEIELRPDGTRRSSRRRRRRRQPRTSFTARRAVIGCPSGSDRGGQAQWLPAEGASVRRRPKPARPTTEQRQGAADEVSVVRRSADQGWRGWLPEARHELDKQRRLEARPGSALAAVSACSSQSAASTRSSRPSALRRPPTRTPGLTLAGRSSMRPIVRGRMKDGRRF